MLQVTILVSLRMSQEHFTKYPPTPRIYYRQKKLLGQALETKRINVATFDFILKNADNRIQKSSPRSELVFQDGDMVSVWIEQFNCITLSDDGISYTDKEKGSVYLPKAIVFYDVPDYRRPSSFYFLAQINDEVELCHARGGDDCPWYDFPNRISVVEDPAIIKKVEKTLDGLKDRIAYAVEQKTQRRRAQLEREAARAKLSPEVKAAYLDLLGICMPESGRKDAVRGIIDGLKDYETDGRGETFRRLLQLVNNDVIPFFIVIDWKTSIGELGAWVRDGVEENFGQAVEFLKDGESGEDLIVSDEAGFPAFAAKLEEIGLQFSFADTGNDEYVFIVHPQKDLNTVKQAFGVLGLPHQSVSDLYK